MQSISCNQSHVHAQFLSVGGATVRAETRLYRSAGVFSKAIGHCLGTVWLCNPGSAVGARRWGPSSSDPTLNVVLDVFAMADRIAKQGGGAGAGVTDYLQILNLHYVCDTNPSRGWGISTKLQPREMEVPSSDALFCWLAWGEVPHGLLLQNASLLLGCTDCFYYDATTQVVRRSLQQLDRPMHPYGALRHRKSHPNYVCLLAHEMATRLP